jgi:hypothetical protein
MDIPFPIRLPMMKPMMRRPPQDSLLRGTLRQEGHHELRNPVKLVASMSKIPVIASRHAEHADRIGHGQPSQQRDRRRGPQNRQHADMNQQEEEDRPELVFGFGDDGGHSPILLALQPRVNHLSMTKD